MTTASLATLLTAIAVLIYLSALFSRVATALLLPHQLRRLETGRAQVARLMQLFRENPRRVLSMLLLGDGLVNVLLILSCLFVLWKGPIAGRIPQWLAGLAIFAIVVLVCDLVPKLLALSVPYRLSAIGGFVLRLSMPLLDGIGQALEKASAKVTDWLTPGRLRARPRQSEKEVVTLLEMGREAGALYEGEAEMIRSILKLGEKTVRDCMTPRVDTLMVPDDLSNAEVIALLKEKRHRRVPVYAETPDQILGIINAKPFLLDPAEHYTEKLIAPSFVPETMGALTLLKQFLSRPQAIAIVVDEFGGTEGIITIADLIEEIVGDTLPQEDSAFYIEPLGNGKFLVSGNARLDDLSEYLGCPIEAQGIDTIGGLVFTRLGYLPSAGTKLELPGLMVTVRRSGRQRVRELLLEKTTGGGRRPADQRSAAA